MYKIEFFYERELHTNKPIITKCWVEKDGRELGSGEAICHDLDNPVKEVGRKLALARAIHNLPLEERKIVWDTYFKR